jgi:hypothetical protein
MLQGIIYLFALDLLAVKVRQGGAVFTEFLVDKDELFGENADVGGDGVVDAFGWEVGEAVGEDAL